MRRQKKSWNSARGLSGCNYPEIPDSSNRQNSGKVTARITREWRAISKFLCLFFYRADRENMT
ncbi:MAG: hypothetical protein JRI62_10495 [Deltaproteobacteria bacterium]|nr:hypothetical protein [Deltaproteobacteria bacterium]